MTRLPLIALGACLLGALPATAGSLGTAMELEHARANARAGGPISENDAELLERYGCLSGTKSRFCQELSNRDKRYYKAQRRPQRARD